MTLKNKYLYRSRVTEWKFRQILELFCEDLNATKIASLTELNPFRVILNPYIMGRFKPIFRILILNSFYPNFGNLAL